MSAARTRFTDADAHEPEPRAPPERREVTGVILAGGRGRRMGGADKGLLHWRGRPLVEWSLAALTPQVGPILISANRHREDYARYGHPVIADRHPEFAGPLAGILAAMEAAATGWILTVPCDDPQPPPDLLTRLVHALTQLPAATLAVATDGQRLQPLYLLAPVTLAAPLAARLGAGERRVEHWLHRQRAARAAFDRGAGGFVNLNRPDDYARLDHTRF